LGSGADIELVYARADFSDPNTAIARTPADPQSERDAGRSGDAEPTGPDPSKSYVMVDAPVEKGKYYLPPVLDPKDGRKKVPRGPHYRSANSIGWTNQVFGEANDPGNDKFETRVAYHIWRGE
jgi:hypothetical protein